MAFSQSLDEEEWSGTAKLAYRFTDDVMSYLSYASGYKAGGFNLYRERNGNLILNPTAAGGPAVDRDTHFEKETGGLVRAGREDAVGRTTACW